MIDPIFGIKYELNKIIFENVPLEITNMCNFKNLNYTDMWIYAHYNYNNIEYFIVSGIQLASPDGPGPANYTISDLGVVLSIDNCECKYKSAPWILSGRTVPDINKLSHPKKFIEVLHGFFINSNCTNGECYSELKSAKEQQILEGLFTDALKRYTKAFGSKKSLIDRVSEIPDSHLPLDRYPLIYQKFTKFKESIILLSDGVGP